MVTVFPILILKEPGSAGKEDPLVKIRLVDGHDYEVGVGKPGEVWVDTILRF